MPEEENVMKQYFNNVLKNKNLRIFSIFVLISFVLWFLNALNQDYVSNIQILVNYKNFPQGKANVAELPSKLSADIKANGLEILKYELKKSFTPLDIDLSKVKFDYVSSDSSYAYLLTYRIKDEIEVQLNGKMKIEMLNPDTLFFKFTKLVSKKVPIKLNVKIMPKKQFFIKNTPVVEPDSVTLEGPASILDTIDEVLTEQIIIQDVDKNVKEKTSLDLPEGISANVKNVELLANVEEYSEKNFKIKIITLNVPDSMTMKLYPDYITVVCKVGVSQYNNIPQNAFIAAVDYNSISENIGDKLPVKMISYPSSIYSYSYSPEFVDYILEKKK